MHQKLYSPFKPNLDFSNIDHIVIGSGIGGLTTATWLAKAGRKVVVFERHYKPGGFTHSFKRKQNFQWDTGVHYVGNVGENGSLRKAFNFITNKKLEWEFIGDVYDTIRIEDDIYSFKAGVAQFRKQLIIYFPDEIKAIDQYLHLIKKVSKLGSSFFFEKTFEPILSKSLGWFIRQRYLKYAGRTTFDVLSELTNNSRLIAVLCGQCGNYGLSPKHSSFAAHAIVVNHFIEGAYYPKGGTDQICNKTIETLKNHGGKLYINAEAQKIVVEKNSVIGVVVNDTYISCKSVISNVGLNNTFNNLLSATAKQKYKFNFKSLTPSTGHLCLYVGLDKSDKELNLPKYNIWSYQNEDVDAIINDSSLENISTKFSYISFPSAKDPIWQEEHPNKATIQALTVGKYEWFSSYENKPWMKRDLAYTKLKKSFEISMLERLYVLFPQIKGHVVELEVSTPLSTKHFTNYQYGEIYGLAHIPQRFSLPFLRPKTKIKGLYLTGQDITLVGVAAAMVSGMLCAITILKFRVWRLFKEMNMK